jgi:uncharacterized SAM-dependent methyltransferase
MRSTVPVAIHSSQFPQNVRRELVASLQRRQINHKFHYDSIKQSQKWLTLHQAWSPARTQKDCADMYDRSFAGLCAHLEPGSVNVVGLGCGGGQKDARLLELLKKAGNRVAYTPVDVSLPLVLTAREAALTLIPESPCYPLVCDLGNATDLPQVLDELMIGQSSGLPSSRRVFTFFGMLPNFEPDLILPRLVSLFQPGDLLLLSANLAPGNVYASGVQQILPQYDNELTRDWLLTLLLDLGMEKQDGELRFAVEDICARGLEFKRVTADFQFLRPRELQLGDHHFAFRAHEKLRLFFSYRHTPELVRKLLSSYGLTILQQWVAESGEEGVFLVG